MADRIYGDLVIPNGMFDNDPDAFAVAVAFDLATKGFYFKPGFIEESLSEWIADLTPSQHAEYTRRIDAWKSQRR